jgi:hypothetical protein
MKKLSIILLVVLCACLQEQNISTFSKEPKTIRNSKCENIKVFQVFQVLDNYSLAFACKEDENDHCYDGHIVYIPKQKGVIYFDDQIINVKDGECPIYTGTYKYETKDKFLKTVPIVKIINSQIANPAYNK